MFTSIDKAIVAIISGFVFLLMQFGIEIDLPQDTIQAIGTLITAILVYITPNKDKA